MAQLILSWIAVIGGFVSIAFLAMLAGRKPKERLNEDEARAFFDEHGHWPDGSTD